jgi:catechol 2,3-dioxygenase-like lactoylglutathione lyase family enzyme
MSTPAPSCCKTEAEIMTTPPRLAVHHLAVVVRDLERAEAFYGGVLGLPVERRWADDRGAPRSVWLSLGGGAFLAIELASADLPPRPAPDLPGWHCVALAIAPSEREPLRAHLAAAGFPVEKETAFTLYTRDPEGNLIALSHHPSPV